MQRRIFGLETEYGITCAHTKGGPAPLDAESAARELFRKLAEKGRSTNVFLPNGGRLYLDVGAHPEYATAEADSLWDLLAQDRAGGELLQDMAAEATENLQQTGVPGRLHLFRNNADSDGNSFGCHENYLLHRRRDFREVADSLVSFFVTRQVICGAGAIKPGIDGVPEYVFSWRADEMYDALSSASTQTRPIINTRDEPLADASAYRRMHVIVGDSNMAEPTTALKVGSSDLLLHAVETGTRLTDLALAAPLEEIRAINRDLSGQRLLELKDGRKMRAVDIQQEILERVKHSVAGVELSELHQYILDLWQRAIHAVATQNWSLIETEIDFAIKKKLVDGYVQRAKVSLADPRLARLLLSFHDITEAGLREKMESSGLMRRLTTLEQVQRAKEVPPATTRASLRGRVIQVARQTRHDLGVDWVHLRVEGEHGIGIALQDPFAISDPRVDDLIARYRSGVEEI